MKRIIQMLTLVTAVVAVLAMSAVPALADSPHFTKASASTDGDGDLVVTFKEAGLGTTVSTETIKVSADAEAVYGCFNKGGKHPQAANKETLTQPVSGGGDFPVRNGSASGSITVDKPGAGDFSCTKGQNLRLISVTYSNITITGSGGEQATTPGSVTWP